MIRVCSLITMAFACSLLSSCLTTRPMAGSPPTTYVAGGLNDGNEVTLTQSLFDDKTATISEEGIQKVLAGNYQLPQKLRVAVIRLQGTSSSRRRYYFTDEAELKTQQSYLDRFTELFKSSSRVTKVMVVPDLLVPRSPGYTSIREAAVRMQADVVVVYTITGDLYSKYKFFTKPDIKAFANTQLVMMDVRTGLIAFSAISTKDFLSQKTKEELDNNEASARIQNEAVLLTITDIGQQLNSFLQ